MRRTLAHLFFPSERNNFKSKLLHGVGIYALLSFLILFQILLKALPQTGVKVLGYAANISTSDVIRLTNEKRAAAGLPALKENSVLSEAAHKKGLDMIEDDYWAHIAPDGKEPWAFFASASYKYRYAGENLARDFANAQSAVDAWMASPSHRDNIMSPKYQEIGIGVVEGDLAGVDTTIIVQFFGTKLDTLPSVPIASAEAQEPTPEPTVAPAPKVAALNKEPLESSVTEGGIVADSVVVSKSVSYVVIGSLSTAMLIDSYVVTRRKIARQGGRLLAHLSFFAMIFIILLIAKAGQIV